MKFTVIQNANNEILEHFETYEAAQEYLEDLLSYPPYSIIETEDKPPVKLIGEDGNIFAILLKCKRALEEEGEKDKAEEMAHRVTNSESYDQALSIVMEYVEPL